MAVLIDAYRQVFFYGLPPDWMAMLYPSIVSILTCFAGYILYRNQLHKIFDLI
jgi:lipopolysaccharide transport system permease protein